MRGIGHVNLHASAEIIECLRRFHVDLIDLAEGRRPMFRSGLDGHWLYAGDRAVVHLTIARDGYASAQLPGVFDHLAFDGDNLEGTRARLHAAGIIHETKVVDELHQTQLFLSEPAGTGVELTFSALQPELR